MGVFYLVLEEDLQGILIMSYLCLVLPISSQTEVIEQNLKKIFIVIFFPRSSKKVILKKHYCTYQNNQKHSMKTELLNLIYIWIENVREIILIIRLLQNNPIL